MHKHVMTIDAAQEILDLCADLLTPLAISTTNQLLSACTLEDVHLVQPNLLIIDYPPGGEHVTYELLQQLRATPATAHIPVLVWTTHHHVLDTHKQWFTEQDIPIIPKPCAIEWFLSIIQEHLCTRSQTPRTTPNTSEDSKTFYG